MDFEFKDGKKFSLTESDWNKFIEYMLYGKKGERISGITNTFEEAFRILMKDKYNKSYSLYDIKNEDDVNYVLGMIHKALGYMLIKIAEEFYPNK